jgi:phosphatidylinositol glycan class O
VEIKKRRLTMAGSVILEWIHAHPRRATVMVTLLAHIGLGLFIGGFLMTRVEVANVSSYHRNDQAVDTRTDTIAAECSDVPLPAKKRVLLFIIDALRWDFIQHNEEDFPYVHRLLRQNQSQTALFRLYADPPTTTSQRLKGLTTGSLPTFIDINANFNRNNNQAIREDNLIGQMKRAGKK